LKSEKNVKTYSQTLLGTVYDLKSKYRNTVSMMMQTVTLDCKTQCNINATLPSVVAVATTIADSAVNSHGKDTDDARGIASDPANVSLQIMSFSHHLATTVLHWYTITMTTCRVVCMTSFLDVTRLAYARWPMWWFRY